MNIHQISVFLENRAGQLAELTRLLADNGVDMRAISIAETADYGVVRIIADDSQKASAALLAHGAILSVTPVWAVEVPDQAGGLAALLEVLAANHVSVEYMYSLFTHRDGMAYMVLRIAEEENFLRVAEEHGIRIMDAAALGLR